VRRRSSLEERNFPKEIRMNYKYTSLLGVDKPFGEEGEETNAVSKNRIISTQNFINKLSAEVLSPNLITPPNCRYMERFNEGTLVVVEQPPAIRTICVNIGMRGYLETLDQQGKLEEYGYENFLKENKSPYYFTLAFPFMIFMFTISNHNEIMEGRVACRTKQMSGMADMLFKVPLNNITRGDHVCWPNGFYAKRASVYSATMLGIKAWWSSVFNSDYSQNVNEYKDKGEGLGNYLEWNYLTKLNPLFIYNAKWIRLRKLEPTLKDMIISQGFTNLHELNFQTFQKLFTQPTPTGKLVKPHKRARKKKPLFYDICQSAFLSANIIVHVGDKFKYSRRRKRYGHVESFMGIMGTGRPSHIAINVDNKIIKMKLTNKVKRYISRKVNYYRKATKITINGVEIRKGDLISFKGLNKKKLYKKVEYIQKTIDGQIEIKAKEFYLASNMEDVEIIDTQNVDIDGLHLEVGKQYIIVPESFRTALYQNASIGKFSGVNVDSYGIYFEFEKVDHFGSYKVRPKTSNRNVFEMNEFPAIKDKTFFIGRKLLSLYTTEETVKEKDIAWQTPYGIMIDKHFGTTASYWSDVKKLINNDTFSVKGVHSNIEFKVGDLVVTSDWETPLNMLSIKRITGFEIDDNVRGMSFLLEDKHGEKSKHIYIQDTNSIRTGTVRKVSTSIGKFEIGTKLISNTNDFPGFPEGSVNIVVAFITDTGIDEPLVLCSNCQTLWLNDIRGNFTKVKKTSQRWVSLQHLDFDVEDIKFQTGDIINGRDDYYNSYGYIVCCEDEYREPMAYLLQYVDRYPEHYDLDGYFRREMIFDGILNPRFPQEEMSNRGEMIYGWPSLMGLIYQTNSQLSVMKFSPKHGRIINV
jgi:hypothetical protein